MTDRANKLILWIAATAGAALIGATVKSIYDMARPSIVLVEVRPSLSLNKQFVDEKTEVDVPQGLRRLLEKSLWVSLADFRESSAKYSSLIEGLDGNQERMRTHLRAIESLNKDLPVMKAILERGDGVDAEGKNRFFDLWERNDAFIYGSIRGEYRRGELSLAPRTYQGEPFFRLFAEEFPINDQQVKLWMVSKVGGRFNSILVPDSLRDLPIQKEVAESLAYFDSARLGQYLKPAETDASDLDTPRQIIKAIEDSRTDFSRLGVTVTLSNSGSKPIAFLPYGELVVRTKGLVSNSKEVGSDTVIPLQLRNGSSEPEAIQVKGGEAVLVTLASAKFIKDLTNGQVITDIYKMGARTCFVRLAVTGVGFFADQYQESPEVKFAPSETFESDIVGND